MTHMGTTTIVDREEESASLRHLLDQGTPQLALLYGRRRVGKTYLLSHMWPSDVTSFYFTASETSPQQNRAALVHAFAAWSGQSLHAEDYPTWRTVFRLLLTYSPARPVVLTIDEFQYLGDDDAGLKEVASALNAEWEPRLATTIHQLVVLSGSAVRMMEQLAKGGSPLYGRFDMSHRLQPFDYWNAGRMSGYTGHRDQARTYGVFGGTPRYLANIDAGTSWVQNVYRQMLAPDGNVRELVHTALQQEQGLRDLPKYVAILRAIGGGRVAFGKVGQLAGQHTDRGLRDKLERLVQLGYVSGTRNVGAAQAAAKRYHIADPALRFYYTLIAPHESMLVMNPAPVIWKALLEHQFETLMGHVFEDMVADAYRRRHASGDTLPPVMDWGRWEGQDRNRDSLEVDIVAPLASGRAVLTGAVKWNTKPVPRSVHTGHLAALTRLQGAGVAWAHDAVREESPLLYVAAGGFTDEFVAAATASRPDVRLWTLKDLYEFPPALLAAPASE